MTSASFLPKNKTALIGFDGFIDKLFRIKRNSNSFFEKSIDFGEYITEKNGNNFSLEVLTIISKIGGNAANFSNAIGNLGIENTLIASLGSPKINPIFDNLPKNCNKISFAEPGIAYAYEFNDSKIMLAENGVLNNLNWDILKENIGIEKLVNLFEINDLYCLMNWAEITGMTSIWQGILYEILPNLSKKKQKTTFFDLADCSNREPEDVKYILDVITNFTKFTKVVLSLNKNETETIFNNFSIQKDDDFKAKGEKIFNELGIDKLILHNSTETYCFTKNNTFYFKPLFIENPKFSTGAGDHFNAGFCAALLNELSIQKALEFANNTAYLYISTGKSPNFTEVNGKTYI